MAAVKPSGRPQPRLLIAVNTAEFFLSHRVHLASGAKADGWDVWVLCPPSPKIKQIEALGLSVVAVEIGRKSMNPFAEIFTVVRIMRAIRDLQPDVFHGFTVKPVLYGTFACRVLGVKKIVNTITGLGFLFISQSPAVRLVRSLVGWMYRVLFASPNVHVIFQNEDDRDLFVKNKWAHPERHSVIKGTGVDTSYFAPAAEPEGVPVVVFPARLLTDKGVREMIAAAEILRQRGRNMKLELCGRVDAENPAALSPGEVEELKKRGDLFVLRGHVEDMAEVFRRCHVVCLPSYREGLPLALLEAAASGRPMVTTNVPGCRSVVEDGAQGFLVPARDSRKLADALEVLILSKGLREKMGASARARAVQEFAKDQIVRQNLSTYLNSAAPQSKRAAS